MKIKSIISMLFVLVITIFYFFGICEWDLPVYILCVSVAAISMFIFIRQEKRYSALQDKEEKLKFELK